MSNMNFPNLQVGIVGAGLMGRWHSIYAKRLGVQLVSILDYELSHAQRLSVELGGGADIFTDIDSMLSQSQPDVIHICTPLESHYPIAMQAIEAGVHVIVEKPMAASVAETEKLLEASRNKGVSVCPVHQFGFQDGVLNALTELNSLGELLHLRFMTGSAGGEVQPKSTLNDIIADIIPHPLSVLQRLRPGINLDTRQWSGVHSRDGELQIIGDAEGVAVDIYISMNARPTRCEMELFCSKGRLYLNFFHGYVVIETGHVSRAQKMIQPFRYAWKELFVAGINITRRGLARELAYPGLSRLIENFYIAITTGIALPISATDSLAVAVARDELTQRLLTDNSVSH